MLWRRSGRLSLTVIAKATLAIVADGAATLAKPVDLCREPKLLSGSRALFAESDVVPYKPRAEVVYSGSAWAPRPVQALHARLGVFAQNASIEKAVQVVGDRASENAQPAPFARMPLSWERAWAGAQGENPLGVPPRSG